MKKTPLLNTELSETISKLGHLDLLAVGDAGMPIPAGPKRIDLALTAGVPSFFETVTAILSEMQVQGIIVAAETEECSPHILRGLLDLLPGVSVETVSHNALKERTRSAAAMVRTGEFTPYANVILVAGVVF